MCDLAQHTLALEAPDGTVVASKAVEVRTVKAVWSAGELPTGSVLQAVLRGPQGDEVFRGEHPSGPVTVSADDSYEFVGSFV